MKKYSHIISVTIAFLFITPLISLADWSTGANNIPGSSEWYTTKTILDESYLPEGMRQKTSKTLLGNGYLEYRESIGLFYAESEPLYLIEKLEPVTRSSFRAPDNLPENIPEGFSWNSKLENGIYYWWSAYKNEWEQGSTEGGKLSLFDKTFFTEEPRVELGYFRGDGRPADLTIPLPQKGIAYFYHKGELLKIPGEIIYELNPNYLDGRTAVASKWTGIEPMFVCLGCILDDFVSKYFKFFFLFIVFLFFLKKKSKKGMIVTIIIFCFFLLLLINTKISQSRQFDVFYNNVKERAERVGKAPSVPPVITTNPVPR